jgi:hypothetical protein
MLMALWGLMMGACAPALDWRDVRLAGAELTVLFPCKPAVQERTIELDGRPWSARLQACDAGDQTFAALTLTPPTPEAAVSPSQPVADMAPLLAQLVESAAVRWGVAQGAQLAPPGIKLPAAVQGTWSRHVRDGQGGKALLTQALFLPVQGHLVQLSMHGAHLSEPAMDSFFGQLRVGS